MQIEIRPCHAADAAALALVGQATFLETYPAVLPASDILAHARNEHGEARYAQFLADPAYALWLAEVEGTRAPVGYAVLCPPDLPVAAQPGDLELKRIYLLSRFHGGGLGGRLMATALEAAHRRGARRLLLGVYNGNEAALAFYARQGFTRAGVRKFQVGANTYDDLVLAREV